MCECVCVLILCAWNAAARPVAASRCSAPRPSARPRAPHYFFSLTRPCSLQPSPARRLFYFYAETTVKVKGKYLYWTGPYPKPPGDYVTKTVSS